ncbi:MAG TPA: hypothetical protein VK835_14755 [Bacteroidia bacterium]|jgi:hypothetical protein|nr:hypothetical protein [Bacteroidia bacterium]
MKKIELRKARDFGTLFNDSVAFLRTNFKSFFGILLFLSGPFVLLTGLLMGYLQFISEKITESNMLSGNYRGASMFLGSSVTTTLLFVLIFLLTTLVTNASIALYFTLYDKAKPEELPIQRSSISQLLAAACWRLFYNLLLFSVISVVIALAFTGLFFLLFLVPGLNIVLIFVLVIAGLIFFPPLIYVITVANFIVIRDEILITEAIGKALKYMRGHFWKTWLFIFCALVSLSMLYLLFSLPSVMQGFINGFTRGVRGVNTFATNHTLMYIIFSAVSMLGRMIIISPILTCFCVFNFYSQEESHEGTSLMNRIDTFDIK